MKRFDKPSCEIIRFSSNVIVTSTCGCYNPRLGVMGEDCTGDVGYCAGTVNHNPADDNCTPCNSTQGA